MNGEAAEPPDQYQGKLALHALTKYATRESPAVGIFTFIAKSAQVSHLILEGQ